MQEFFFYFDSLFCNTCITQVVCRDSVLPNCAATFVLQWYGANTSGSKSTVSCHVRSHILREHAVSEQFHSVTKLLKEKKVFHSILLYNAISYIPSYTHLEDMNWKTDDMRSRGGQAKWIYVKLYKFQHRILTKTKNTIVIYSKLLLQSFLPRKGCVCHGFYYQPKFKFRRSYTSDQSLIPRTNTSISSVFWNFMSPLLYLKVVFLECFFALIQISQTWKDALIHG